MTQVLATIHHQWHVTKREGNRHLYLVSFMISKDTLNNCWCCHVSRTLYYFKNVHLLGCCIGVMFTLKQKVNHSIEDNKTESIGTSCPVTFHHNIFSSTGWVLDNQIAPDPLKNDGKKTNQWGAIGTLLRRTHRSTYILQVIELCTRSMHN